MTKAKTPAKKKARVAKNEALNNMLMEKIPHFLNADQTKIDARSLSKRTKFTYQYIYWSLKNNRLSKKLADALIKLSEEYREYETCPRGFKPLTVYDCWEFMN